LQRALSTIVLLGLLLASAAAFAITEHLKLIKSPIYGPQVTVDGRRQKVFSPVCHCALDKAEISFKLRHPDSITVSIVDSGRNVIATLPEKVDRRAKKVITFSWNGRNSAGQVARDGTYQPQVKLAGARRTILMPNKIGVDTVAPNVVSANVGGGGILIKGGRGIPIRYVLGEKAHVSVFIRGRRVLLGRRSRPTGKVQWNGKAGGKPLPVGRYVLEVAAVDVAGNETPPAQRKPVVVRIRYIDLAGMPAHVRRGASFSVKVRTGAPKYTWKFAGTRGTGKQKLLHLRAPAHRGRYRLVVSAQHHPTAAIVIVGPQK